MKNYLAKKFSKHAKIIKYLIAGVTATLVNFATVYLLTDIFGVWYLLSSSSGFIVSFGVSFYLQKFWTFSDKDKSRIYRQMIMYLGVAGLGFVVNDILMFAQVSIFGLWYMAAQFFTAAFLAFINYLFYNFIIFKKKPLNGLFKNDEEPEIIS